MWTRDEDAAPPEGAGICSRALLLRAPSFPRFSRKGWEPRELSFARSRFFIAGSYKTGSTAANCNEPAVASAQIGVPPGAFARRPYGCGRAPARGQHAPLGPRANP